MLYTDQNKNATSMGIKTLVRIRMRGHASPRWKGAASDADADWKNEKLSAMRAANVTETVRRQLSILLGRDQFIYNNQSVSETESGVLMETGQAGSTDSLHSAKGSRKANDQAYKKVDVFVKLDRVVDGEAPFTAMHQVKYDASTILWSINMNWGASGGFGPAGGSVCGFRLTNRRTKQYADGQIFTTGMAAGVKWKPVGASYSFGSPVDFTTEKAMNLADFDGMGVRFTSLGAGIAIIGYDASYLTIYGIGDGAQGMYVGGANMGSLGFSGAAAQHGNMTLNRPISPGYTIANETYDDWDPYRIKKHEESGHVVYFDTGSALMAADEEKLLQHYIANLARSFKAS
jgi:hypothetical protein